MLKRMDLSKDLDKASYKQSMDALALRLSEAQRACRDEKIPVIVLFEGWSAAGKGSRMGALIRCLDPRGFEVFSTQAPTEEEILRPYMWRFWRRTPAAGRIHVFDRSWYRILTLGEGDQEVSLTDPVRDILSFETMLADTGVVIVKLFLHISRKEQAKRMKELEASPETAWRVSKRDWAQNRDYDKYQTQFERMLEKTDHDRAKWTVVEAEHSRFADAKVFLRVVEAMEEAVLAARAKRERGATVAEVAPLPPVDVR
jgi:polyphosphate kinase 2 (PPK2 family)